MIRQGVLRASLPVLFLVSSLCPGMLEAGAPPVATDLLPSSLARDKVREDLGRRLGVQVTLLEAETLLLDSVRWSSPDPARNGCQNLHSEVVSSISVQRRVPVPDSPIATMGALLAQADAQVRYLDLKPAMDTLKQARAWIPCVSSRLTQDQVRALFLTEALAHLFAWDGEQEAAFQQVVAVAPGYSPERSAPSKVKEALKSAARSLHKGEEVIVEGGDSGGALFVDGRPMAAQIRLSPGLHVLQIEGTTGEIRSSLVSIGASGPVRMSSITTFGILPAPEAREALAIALRGEKVSPELTKVFEQRLETSHLDWQAYVVEMEEVPRLRIYRRGGTVIDGERLVSGQAPAPAGGDAPLTVQTAGATAPMISTAGPRGAETVVAAPQAQLEATSSSDSIRP